MDLTQALLADLRDLAVDAAQASYTQTTVALLHLHLHRLVPSALGASIVIADHTPDRAVRLDLVTRRVDPSEIGATLRIPLTGLVVDADSSTDGWVDLHAGESNAFDVVLTRLAPTLRPLDPPSSTAHHPHLVSPPVTPLVPGLTNFSDLTQVNLALGILWNRGLNDTQARAELQRRADDIGTDLAGAARALLQSW